MKLHNLKHTCIIPVLCAALLIPSYTVHADWEYNAEENTLRYKTKDGTYLTSVFRKIKGYTYYFNADGTVHTGWLDLKGDRYFFSESGAMLTSQWIGNKFYQGIVARELKKQLAPLNDKLDALQAENRMLRVELEKKNAPAEEQN